MTRLKVFVDYQNLYHGARNAFGADDASPTWGHVHLLRLGVLLRQLGEEHDPNRELTEVRVYRGEPGTRSHPTLVSAFQRQVAAWRQLSRVHVMTRPLRYSPTRWDHTGRAIAWDSGREKGIDVLIALDMALGAVRDEYDVAVLFSGDTDLVPAVDAVITAGKWIEGAVWKPDDGPARPLRASHTKIWTHLLDRHRFDHVADHTDYVA